MLFKNREEAGEKLADFLKDKLEYRDTIVLALPRGGVPVAFKVAERLNLKFSILPVRKLGVPSNPELAFGSLDPDGDIYLNKQIVTSFGITEKDIQEVKEKEMEELRRRLETYLNGQIAELENREVLIIDDGFATGYTALAACGFAKKRNPHKVILSAPVGPSDVINFLKTNCADEVFLLETPEPFFAVGMFYEDFHQLTDKEVLEYRERAKALGLWEP